MNTEGGLDRERKSEPPRFEVGLGLRLGFERLLLPCPPGWPNTCKRGEATDVERKQQ